MMSYVTGAGQAAIVKVTRDGSAEPLPLKDVMFSKVTLPNPAQGKGAATSITSMAFLDGRLFVAGLSSEEFASAAESCNDFNSASSQCLVSGLLGFAFSVGINQEH